MNASVVILLVVFHKVGVLVVSLNLVSVRKLCD